MIIEINNPLHLILGFLLFITWVFYGLYLRGMIFGRYNELTKNKGTLNTKALKIFLKTEYLYGIFWILGIAKIPNEDKKLKDLIFKQRIWLIVGIVLVILVYFTLYS